jgi:hypothetical protein
MNKEKLFDDLKDLILTLKKNPYMKSDVFLVKKWQDKQQKVLTEIKKLSIDDHKWLDQQYQIWYKKEIA